MSKAERPVPHDLNTFSVCYEKSECEIAYQFNYLILCSAFGRARLFPFHLQKFVFLSAPARSLAGLLFCVPRRIRIEYVLPVPLPPHIN